MKAIIGWTVAFAFLFVIGQGLLIGAAEPVRLMFWGLALLSLSSGAKRWMEYRARLEGLAPTSLMPLKVGRVR